jgi:hypothetical protein
MKSIIGIAVFLLVINVLIMMLLTIDAVLANQNLVSILNMIKEGLTITGIVAIIVLAIVEIKNRGQAE